MSLLNNPAFMAQAKAEVIKYIDCELSLLVPQFLSLENADHLTRQELSELSALRLEINTLKAHRNAIQPQEVV